MAHAGLVRGSVPMLHARCDPDDIAGLDLALRLAPFLDPSRTESDDQHLAGGMRVPGGARARVEADVPGRHPALLAAAELPIDPHGSREIGLGTLGGGAPSVRPDLNALRERTACEKRRRNEGCGELLHDVSPVVGARSHGWVRSAVGGASRSTVTGIGPACCKAARSPSRRPSLMRPGE